jgi:anti-sigma factor RsiW
VSCTEIRVRLAEYALGVLSSSEAREVARHLEWCAGCQKESEELREGATAIALSLADAGPPAGLEARVVDTLAHAAGRGRPPSRHVGIKTLAVATLVTGLVAVGAMGWALAERNRAQDIRSRLTSEFARFERAFAGGQGSFRADLVPPSGTRGLAAQAEGTTLIYSSPQTDDIIVTSAFFPQTGGGPYTFRLLDRSGTLLAGGTLLQTARGGLLAWESSGRDLSKGVAVEMFSGSGRLVLTGSVRSAVGG